jgi:hypothetical protein
VGLGQGLTQVASVASDTGAGWDGPDDSEEDRQRRPDEGEDQTSEGTLTVP